MRLQPVAIGQVYRMRAPWARAEWGTVATVTAVCEAYDRPHPGICSRTLVDLISENGTRLQWSVSMLRGYASLVK